MKKFLLVLSLGASIISYTPADARIIAKPLPTNAALFARFEGLTNGYIGEVGRLNERIRKGTEMEFNTCVTESEDDILALAKLFDETAAIMEYYRIVEGSEEALKNFGLWEADILKTYPKLIKKVETCYINKITGVTETQKL